jgi:acetylornithine/succinyldiaminopimelate/putrescine aminotransferase
VTFPAFAQYVNPPLAKFLALSGRGQRFVRAQGCSLETDSGELYSDWVAGFGSLNLGHNPPALLDALKQHLGEGAPNLYIESLNPFAGRLAERLVHAAGAGFGSCYFCNSGAEAVEAAIKLAMAATRRRGVVYCQGAYHGTTLGSLSMMAQGEYRAPFEPLLPEFHEIPFNDLGALSLVLEKKPAALVLEPIQVESGVRVLGAGFLAAARELCREHGTLLVLDEVQTGMGRTGRLFAFQHEGAAPDILVLAKSLGGGVMPLGAVVAGKGLFERAYGDPLRCEIHNSTFGGNALACRAGCETLALLEVPGFLDEVAKRGEQLAAMVNAAIGAHPLVARVVFRGLLGGITLKETGHPWFSWAHWGVDELCGRPASAALLVHRMLRRKFLVQICGHDWSTLRIEPPLIVTQRQCEEFVAALAEELDWIQANG